MKKVVAAALVVAALLASHLLTFKEVGRQVVPVAAITDSNLYSMYVMVDGETVRTPQHLDKFTLIKDPIFGSPNGSFYLIKKVNLFGAVKYDATI